MWPVFEGTYFTCGLSSVTIHQNYFTVLVTCTQLKKNQSLKTLECECARTRASAMALYRLNKNPFSVIL